MYFIIQTKSMKRESSMSCQENRESIAKQAARDVASPDL